MTGFLFSLIILSCLCLLFCLKLPNRRAYGTAWVCFGLFSILVWISLGDVPSITASGYTATSIQIMILLSWLFFRQRPHQIKPCPDAATQLIILWCTFEIVLSTTQTAPPAASRIEALAHPLAFVHLTTVMTAKAASLLVVCEALGRIKAPHSLTFAAFSFQGIAIISGMIWALDAWNALWQWDPIETLSLLSLLCLLGAIMHKRACWYQALLICVIATDLLASGLFTQAVSRHSYAAPSQLTAFYHLVWAASILLIHNAHKPPKPRFVPLTCSLVIIFLAILTTTGYRFNGVTLGRSLGVFILILAGYAFSSLNRPICLKSLRRPAYLILFAVLLFTLPGVDARSEQYTLTPLEQQTPCGQTYFINIQKDGSEVMFGNTNIYFRFSDINALNHCISGRHIYRLRSSGYEADKGLFVTFTDVTRTYAWLLFIIALALAAYGHLYPPPDEHEGEREYLE